MVEKLATCSIHVSLVRLGSLVWDTSGIMQCCYSGPTRQMDELLCVFRHLAVHTPSCSSPPCS